MGSIQQTLLAYGAAASSDPHFANVSLLVNGDNAIGIVDVKGHPLTVGAGVTIVTTDTRFPSGCIAFAGTAADFIAVTGLGTELQFPGGSPSTAVTIEFSYKPAAVASTYPCPFGWYSTFAGNGGFAFFDRHAGAPTLLAVPLNGNFPFVSTAAASNGVWGDYGLQREADGTVTLFKNGVAVDSDSYSGDMKYVGGLNIGSSPDLPSDSYISGLMAKIRVTKGVARYDPGIGYTPDDDYFPT